MRIQELSTSEFEGAVAGLAAVLVDAVADGASVGFSNPFGQQEAEAWWRQMRPGYATDPDGKLEDSSFFHKRIPS